MPSEHSDNEKMNVGRLSEHSDSEKMNVGKLSEHSDRKNEKNYTLLNN